MATLVPVAKLTRHDAHRESKTTIASYSTHVTFASMGGRFRLSAS